LPTIEEVSRKKWIALLAFLLMDVIQIFLVSMITLDESTIWVVGFDAARRDPLISTGLFVSITILQILMLYIVSMRMLRTPEMVEIHPSFKDETWECKYTPQEITQWTLEIVKKSGVSIKKIYVVRSPLPNAFTFSLPLIGAIVALHTNLLDLLKPEEVQAIIAHEVGHIKNHDSLISIFARMPAFFVDAIYLYIYVRLGLAVASSLLAAFDPISAGARAIALVGFFILSRLLMSIAQLFIQSSSRQAELMSDYHSATVTSPADIVNGLIRLGQRVEAVTSLIEEIRWLESLNPERSSPITTAELNRMILSYPLDGIDETNAREMAPHVFLSTRLKHMVEVYGIYLSEEQIGAAVAPATIYLREKRRDSSEDEAEDEPTESQTIDWRDTDYDGDRRLSSDELNDFIIALRTNPEKLMFESEIGSNILTLDHPDFGKRILFLADAFSM
jgi:Zn-dependent protease with chaperone function